jgi:outer membrane protein assembly factor BamB
MTCLDAATGHVKWQRPHLPSGYQSPQDIFVIGNAVWCGSLNSKPGEFDRRYPDVSPSTGEFVSYDLETGEPGRTIPRGANCYWFHHRCHRAKATVNYFLTSRTGIEMIDVRTGEWSLHHWARGACVYGLMPANGLIYGPPHPCACYPEAKLSGFNALAGARESRIDAPAPEAASRLTKGPAFGAADRDGAASVEDWPTFRGNIARSGSTATAVRGDMSDARVAWRTRIGGRLSAPVVAGGRLFVARVDAHSTRTQEKSRGRSPPGDASTLRRPSTRGR